MINIQLIIIYDTPFYLCNIEHYENNILIKNEFDHKMNAIYKQNSNDSRGFGFLNLTSYIDFLDILRNNKPFILREKILIIK